MTTTDIVLSDIKSMREHMPGELQFWERLAQHHAALISLHGFQNFKRTVNFEYGQWAVGHYGHPFLMHALQAVLSGRHWPTGLAAHFIKSNLSHVVWAARGGAPSAFQRSAYAKYCGLIWQMAVYSDRLGCTGLPEPDFGNPLPVYLSGRLISQDLAITSLEINRLAEFKDLRSTRRALEIGGGHGRTAYAICSLFPDIQYFIVDIPPALAVSQNYLAHVFGEPCISRWSKAKTEPRRINFLTPDQLNFDRGYFDLAINLSSFDEMPANVSIAYLEKIQTILNGILYLTGHPCTSDRGDSRLGLDELPYPKVFEKLSSRPHPTATVFVEKIFRVN